MIALKKELETRIIERARQDENFRRQLLENPRKSLENELGITLPATLDIKIIEEKLREKVLVIPHKPSENPELNDSELESVAGGWTAITDCGTCAYC